MSLLRINRRHALRWALLLCFVATLAGGLRWACRGGGWALGGPSRVAPERGDTLVNHAVSPPIVPPAGSCEPGLPAGSGIFHGTLVESGPAAAERIFDRMWAAYDAGDSRMRISLEIEIERRLCEVPGEVAVLESIAGVPPYTDRQIAALRLLGRVATPEARDYLVASLEKTSVASPEDAKELLFALGQDKGRVYAYLTRSTDGTTAVQGDGLLTDQVVVDALVGLFDRVSDCNLRRLILHSLQRCLPDAPAPESVRPGLTERLVDRKSVDYRGVEQLVFRTAMPPFPAEVRGEALGILALQRSPAARQIALDAATRDPDPYIRQSVVAGLDESKSPEFISTLETIARTDPDRSVQMCAVRSIEGLVYYARPLGLAALRGLLTSHVDDHVRLQAASALHVCGEDHWLEVESIASSTSDESTKILAANLLATRPSEKK